MMAECIKNVCDHCTTSIESWSDGNPYYLDESGTKKYAHHPNHEALEMCIGNDSPHLCLGCGERFMMDSRAPVAACSKCQSEEICDTTELDGNKCPFCATGTFARDEEFFVIS